MHRAGPKTTFQHHPLLLLGFHCFSSPPTALLESIYLPHPRVHVQHLTSLLCDATGAEMSLFALQHDDGNSENTRVSLSDLSSLIALQQTFSPPHPPSSLSCSVLPRHLCFSHSLYLPFERVSVCLHTISGFRSHIYVNPGCFN